MNGPQPGSIPGTDPPIRSPEGSTQASPWRRCRVNALCDVGLFQPPKQLVVDRVCAERGSRRPSQKLPSTAIYCHLQPQNRYNRWNPWPSRTGRPASAPGLRAASGVKNGLGGMSPSTAVCPKTGESTSRTLQPQIRPSRAAPGTTDASTVESLDVSSHDIQITIKPGPVCINPVVELMHAPRGEMDVTLAGRSLDEKRYA